MKSGSRDQKGGLLSCNEKESEADILRTLVGVLDHNDAHALVHDDHPSERGHDFYRSEGMIVPDFIVTARVGYRKELPIDELKSQIEANMDAMDLSALNEEDIKMLSIEVVGLKASFDFDIMTEVTMKGMTDIEGAIHAFYREVSDDLEYEGQKPNEITVEGVRKA